MACRSEMEGVFDPVVQTLDPGFVIPRTGGLPNALDLTRDAFSHGASPVLYQGAFRDRPLSAVVDILRANDSVFERVEVTASTFRIVPTGGVALREMLPVARAVPCSSRPWRPSILQSITSSKNNGKKSSGNIVDDAAGCRIP